MKICIYAFSTSAFFFRELVALSRANNDEIEWSIIFPQGHFRRIVDDLIPLDRRCYLYERFEKYYRSCGRHEVERALAAGEGLQVALLKDKHGYRLLDKDDQIRRGAAIDSCYREFLGRIKPDFVLFPDLEVVDGFVLMNLCQDLNIKCLYYVGMRHLGISFFASDCYETLPSFFGSYGEPDLEKSREFVSAFNAGIRRVPGGRYKGRALARPSWFRRLVVNSTLRVWRERRHATEENLRMRITRNLLPIMGKLRRARFDLVHSHLFDVKPLDALPCRYVLYTLHTNPESSINGLEPYYVDQLRVIDAIILNLPKGHRLLVKEHSSMYGMRPTQFYDELRRRPALVLVHPAVDIQKLVDCASVVCTVTGTVGLEAYLAGKPCVMFGRTFFSHLCDRATEVHHMNATLSNLVNRPNVAGDAQKEVELAKLFNVGADFLIGDPWFFPETMAPENVAAARDYLHRHIRRIVSSVGTRAPL